MNTLSLTQLPARPADVRGFEQFSGGTWYKSGASCPVYYLVLPPSNILWSDSERVFVFMGQSLRGDTWIRNQALFAAAVGSNLITKRFMEAVRRADHQALLASLLAA